MVAQGPISYKIIDTATTGGGKEIRAFIKPLDAKGASGNTNKVFVGSSTGYTDMTCYFDVLTDADAFLQKLVAATNNTNLKVAKVKSDRNGYYVVGTEFGDCGIAAVKLNEEVFTEEITEEIVEEDSKKRNIVNAKGYTIDDIDVYEEAFKRYE